MKEVLLIEIDDSYGNGYIDFNYSFNFSILFFCPARTYCNMLPKNSLAPVLPARIFIVGAGKLKLLPRSSFGVTNGSNLVQVSFFVCLKQPLKIEKQW